MFSKSLTALAYVVTISLKNIDIHQCPTQTECDMLLS